MMPCKARSNTIKALSLFLLSVAISACSHIPLNRVEPSNPTTDKDHTQSSPHSGATKTLNVDQVTPSLSKSTQVVPPRVTTSDDIPRLTDDHIAGSLYTNLWDRLRDQYAFPVHKHPNIDQAQKRLIKDELHFNRVISRSQPFLYYILGEIEARQLPAELAFVPAIESAFDPFAYSSGRASGLWQFIPSTGEMFGLTQNWWYDGRRDIVDSTAAALSYLTLLNKRFDGDWLLTLAAYNCGRGTVLNAIAKNRRQGKPTDFWSLKLPRETRHYVPKILAFANVIKSPEQYGVNVTPLQNQPTFAIVPTNGQISIERAATLAKLNLKRLHQYNPGFNRLITAPNGPHRLLVPIEHSDEFISGLHDKRLNQTTTWHFYKVKAGDNLSMIAQRFDSKVSAIKQANKINSSVIKIGQSLIIPQAPPIEQGYAQNKQAAARLLAMNSPVEVKTLHYSVRPGDNLSSIANRFKVNIDDITQWNKLSQKDLIRAGQPLKLFINVTDPIQ